MAIYKQYEVNKKSQKFFRKVWCLDNLSNEEGVSEKSVLPNGCQNIAIIQGVGININTKKSNYPLTEGVYLSGQMTRRVKAIIKPRTRIILLQLQPWALSSLIDFDGFIDEIKSITPDFLGDDLLLNHQIKCPRTLVKAVDLYSSKIQVARHETLIEKICQQIFVAEGECKVADILANLDFSKRKIQVMFKKTTGLSIKQFINIVRLRSAVDSLVDKKISQGRGADVAVAHHFFDQSHLVKALNKSIGITPSKLDRKQFIMPPKKT